MDKLGSLELDQIHQLDVLEGLRLLPDNSVDLILTDPPYNIGKDAAWDSWKKVSQYVAFMGEVFTECERVLKRNGSFYFFHNDFAQIAELHKWLADNTAFVFNSFVVWDKGLWRANAWKNRKPDNPLRSWFNVCEYAMFYTFDDGTGLDRIKKDMNNFTGLRDYFRDLHAAIGMTKTALIAAVGQRVDHAFRYGSTQWDLPTEETYADILALPRADAAFEPRNYAELKAEYDGYRDEYEGIREGYESQRYVHNLIPEHNNVWRFKTENKGKYHVCQKPLSVIERIVNTSSNPGQIVLDCFMGSGTTAVAAAKLGRRFIGFEREEKYVEIGRKRLAEEAGFNG